MNEHSAKTVPAFLRNVPMGNQRKPRVALMGEFSAGKSTLANMMIGSDPLPVQIVATQLPPVWVSYGGKSFATVDLEGHETSGDIASLTSVDPENTAFIKVQAAGDILRLCDIIDMPGVSDPNMPSEVWSRILPLADAIIWCSTATQAWRQSEAAVWGGIPDAVRKRSILLLTRADMLVKEADKARVLRRVQSETEALFGTVQTISLTEAQNTADCPDKWAACGAEAFVHSFLDLIAGLRSEFDSGHHGLSVSSLNSRRE